MYFNRRNSYHSATSHLYCVVIRTTDHILPEAEHSCIHCLRMTLKYADRVDGRSPEVPQSKGHVHRGGSKNLLLRMHAHVCQLLIMT